MEEIIDTLDLSTPTDFINEAVGRINLNRPGICEIKVKGSEGYIPHFHIENGKGFICCVCLYECLYFTHKQNESKLDVNQKYILDMFMADKNKKNPNITNWQYAANVWIASNDTDRKKLTNYLRHRDKAKEVKPDYTDLDNGPNGTIHEQSK